MAVETLGVADIGKDVISENINAIGFFTAQILLKFQLQAVYKKVLYVTQEC